MIFERLTADIILRLKPQLYHHRLKSSLDRLMFTKGLIIDNCVMLCIYHNVYGVMIYVRGVN